MTQPKIVIHGGAGNSISRAYLTPENRKLYLSAIANILHTLYPKLIDNEDGTSGDDDDDGGSKNKNTALTIACEAVRLLENNELFNAGKGAVFTTEGKNELEASVMVSRGYAKRGVGVFMLSKVKNPILMARELLVRDGGSSDGGKNGTVHNGLAGKYADKLAGEWGLEIVDPGYFWTEKRWNEHLRGLKRLDEGQQSYNTDEKSNIIHNVTSIEEGNISPDEDSANDAPLSKGTVGCVVLDKHGVIAVATSTGGLTNKLPGRIGDTPTIGCGFYAEEFTVGTDTSSPVSSSPRRQSTLDKISSLFCLPTTSLDNSSDEYVDKHALVSNKKLNATTRAVGISGTGDGDYFLRMTCCKDIAARCRYSGISLREAAKAVVGPGGEMARARPKDGSVPPQDGVIGIDDQGDVIMEMNSNGMFRGTVDDQGRVLVAAFADEPLEVWSHFD